MLVMNVEHVLGSSYSIITILLFFSTHQLPPCSCLHHMREDKNIVSCCFVFRVRRIYYELMFHLPCDMCTVKMTSSCQFFLVFLHTIFYLVCAFPTCLLLMHYFLWEFRFCRALFLFPNIPLISCKSFS